MNSKDNKTSRELKREVLQELNQVNNDIDRIQGRLTPGQFIDDALFMPVGRNPRAIFDHLKANPIGTAFLGLGTLLLMEDDSHVTYESQIRNRTSAVYENTRYQATLLKGSVSNVKGDMNERATGVSDKLHGMIDSAKSKVQGVKSKVEGLQNKLTDKAQSFTSSTTGENDLGQGGELGASSIDQLKDNLNNVTEDVTGKIDTFASDVKDNIGNLAGEVKQTAVDQVGMIKNIDPMTYAALGAGLGALTGIALPVSDREQMMIDQKASGKLSEFSSEFQDALNQSVKVLKDEFLGKFTDFDVSLFGRKSQPQPQQQQAQGSNETFSNENPQF